MLGLAIAITADAFKCTKDKGGKPYILHCLRVMNSVIHLGEDYACVAVMHDLLEDTDYTEHDLYEMGFNSSVVQGVLTMTHPRSEPYMDYVMRVALEAIPTAVKMADLRDNSDITRLKGVTQKDLTRMEKYHKAYQYLEAKGEF